MHQRKLAAKPQSKYTPPDRKAKSPDRLKFKCPICRGPMYGKGAKLCRKCRCASRRPSVDRSRYKIRGRWARRIHLTRGQSTFVNAELYKWLMQFSWSARKKEGKDVYYAYTGACMGENRVIASMHHVVLDVHHSVECDHKNGNTLDNLIDNLRPCTDSQNSVNRKMNHNNTSGFRGVYWRKERGTWRALVVINKKRHWLGSFSDPEEAARVRDKAVLECHGEFARLNFPIS